MTTSYDSRLGTSPEEGTKAPCVVITDSEITLAGEQTINSVAVVAGHRVLVGHQSDTTQNGIYVAAAGQWARATDFNLAEDVITGVLIPTPTGLYKATFSGSFVPGTTGVTIEEYLFTTPSTPAVTENPKIAVLGASETVFPWSETWVDHLRKALASEGVNVDVFHTGAGAINHDIALNTPDSLTGQTRVELTNARAADLIIVELGLNDAILAVGGLSQAEMIADAQALYVNLRANNPDAVICYSPLIPYDADQHSALPVSSIKKKYCVPYMHEFSTKTGETALWTTEYSELNQVLSSTMQTRLTNWKALDSAIRGFAEVDVVIETNYFRPARLGLTSHDRVHPNSQGQYFIMSEVWKAFQTNSTIRTAIPELQELRNLGDFTDYDLTWESAVKADTDGDGYDIDPAWTDGFEYPMWLNVYGNTGLLEHAGSWGNQQRATWDVSPVVDRGLEKLFLVQASGLWPESEIQTKLWLATDAEPTTWNSEVPPRLTSKTGTHIASDRPAMANGDYLIKYKVGNDVFGPFPIALSGSYSSGGNSGIVIASFVRTSDINLGTGWNPISFTSEEMNSTGGLVTFSGSTVSIAAAAGYDLFKVHGKLTLNPGTNGVFTGGWSRGGVDQHNRFAGDQVVDNMTSGSGFPPITVDSGWIPLNAAGETLEFIINSTIASIFAEEEYGIVFQVELANLAA